MSHLRRASNVVFNAVARSPLAHMPLWALLNCGRALADRVHRRGSDRDGGHEGGRPACSSGALRNVSRNPWRIVSAALVILHFDHARTI
jgi:hypothetical protein